MSDHYETFRVEAARLRDGEGLPRFVEEEFAAFLRCGWLAGGFARFRCTRCREERLVAFSCKGRGFCPSCGGRRMTERAAHLVDHVWPEVPVRQWVLTLPPHVRYLLAWRHDLCTAVAGVLYRAVHRQMRSWARTRGLGEARSGAVIVVQRFGGALNLNVHLHALVLDGLFARAADGRLRFDRAPAPTAADVADVLRRSCRGCGRGSRGRGSTRMTGRTQTVSRMWRRCSRGWRPRRCRGCWRWAACRGGGRSGWVRRVGRRRAPASGFGGRDPAHARWEGFDLHAGVAVPGHRARLERVCRYVLRPPVTGDRLSADGAGRVVLQLRHPWADGTTHLRFEPTAFLERLAVLAPHAAWRAEVVPRAARGAASAGAGGEAGAGVGSARSPTGRRWADLMRRAFDVEVLACPRWGGGCGSWRCWRRAR